MVLLLEKSVDAFFAIGARGCSADPPKAAIWTQPWRDVVTLTLSFVAYTEINTNFGGEIIPNKILQPRPVSPDHHLYAAAAQQAAISHYNHLFNYPVPWMHHAYADTFHQHQGVMPPLVMPRNFHQELILSSRGRDSTSPKKESTRSPEVGTWIFLFACFNEIDPDRRLLSALYRFFAQGA